MPGGDSMWEYNYISDDNDYLAHYGVRGMKWDAAKKRLKTAKRYMQASGRNVKAQVAAGYHGGWLAGKAAKARKTGKMPSDEEIRKHAKGYIKAINNAKSSKISSDINRKRLLGTKKKKKK